MLQGDAHGVTPLEVASWKGHFMVTRRSRPTVPYSASLPRAPYSAGFARLHGCSPQVVDYLLQEGADANKHDDFGVAPLHKAVGHGQVGGALSSDAIAQGNLQRAERPWRAVEMAVVA